VVCWVSGLTSIKYIEDLLLSKHNISVSISLRKRCSIVAGLVKLACEYLEQAQKGPQDVSFLPLYYALLNLSKAYIVIGPYYNELSQNRKHGASYDTEKKARTLENDYIKLRAKGSIPLLYRTLVGEYMLKNVNEEKILKMRDVYPYIYVISAEYETATGNQPKLIPFTIWIAEEQSKKRVKAKIHESYQNIEKVKVKWLQGFNGLYKEKDKENIFISDLYDKEDIQSIRSCIRPAMLYGGIDDRGFGIQYIPSSGKKEGSIMSKTQVVFKFFFLIKYPTRCPVKGKETLIKFLTLWCCTNIFAFL